MLNEIYLCVLYRPVAGAASGWLSRALVEGAARRPGAPNSPMRSMPARSCRRPWRRRWRATSRSSWDAIGTADSGAPRCSSIWVCSSMAESQRMPLPSGPLNQALVGRPTVFRQRSHRVSLAHETRVGAMLGIKEYPTPTSVGMYDRLLVGADVLRAHAVVRISDQGGRPGAAAASIQSHGERGGLRRLPGRGTQATRSMH